MKLSHIKLVALLLTLTIGLSSCLEDRCTTTRTYTQYTPVYKSMEEVREMVKVTEPREIKKPGKIFTYGDYLFINDRGIGIHIYRIGKGSAPQNIAFLQIPGNIDMSVKGRYLYADNYIDLVVFDLADMKNIKEIGREISAFPNNLTVHEETEVWMVDSEQGIAIDWIAEEVELDCDQYNRLEFSGGFARTDAGNVVTAENGGNSNSGQAGSMARFALMADHLYVIEEGGIKLFDMKDAADPDYLGEVYVERGIETIFPYYRDNSSYLFIGATNGMYIYNNDDPTQPFEVSSFVHVESCDPVVANDSVAFVTLRTGTRCNGVANELNLIDIKNLQNPTLIERYGMSNPHGLGFDDGLLFICDGADGLKVYDLRENNDNVTDKEIAHFEGIVAYDVIPRNGELVLSAEDGFYLIDYTDVNDIKIRSFIPAIKS